MVAIVKSGYSIQRILNYNENKVNEGVAVCIGAENYPLDPDQMNFFMKLNCFQKQMELNQRAKRTSVHVSLNFDPSENNLSTEKLMEIASAYMEGIGFGNQPYLVYQHHDAAHPHIHIVTTNIQSNGSSIDMHLIGKRKSEPARKVIEKQFGLVNAEQQGKQVDYRPEPVSVTQVSYGSSETKKAIQNVLEHVVAQYKYTSLAELNAVLGRYNIMAQRGTEDSRVFKHRGLLYRILDSHGEPIGVPIKASLFYSKPTLDRLQVYFDANKEKRIPHRARVKNAIDMAFQGKKPSIRELEDELSKKGIDLIRRQNQEGIIYGVTYVDHVTKCVFNGSVLGKAYSAKLIQQRCEKETEKAQHSIPKKQKKTSSLPDDALKEKTSERMLRTMEKSFSPSLIAELVDVLIQEHQDSDYVPFELRQSKKKRKKKKKSDNH